MAKQDFYATLGVNRDVSADDLKKAYRKLAMQYHPDRNPGDAAAEQRFKDVSEAYDVLKDPQKRAAYDRMGHAAFAGGGYGNGGAGYSDFPFGGSSFSEMFEEMFGAAMEGRGRARGPARGGDLRYNLEITLEDAFKGAEATIRIPTWGVCEACKGSGGEAGTQPTTCGTCNGNGRVRTQSGIFLTERTCTTCGGTGRVIKDPCRVCGGSGRSRREKTVQVAIPPGVEDGTRIRLPGDGEAGLRGAPPGDLYVFIALKPHRFFQREGADLHVRVPVPMTVAALGGDVEVPTIEGTRTRVAVPPGTQSGAQFRLRAKGMSILRSSQRGDLYVEMAVETPVNLTKRQQDLLREFESAGRKGDQHPQSEGFFTRIKELWQDLTD